ncbi:MAG TPA: hypothetical protein VMW16_11960 [Sedimentisphaerales bacterium]|nr:hypothetical protein [Sedimentisphaerales bacterium]
MNRAQKMAWLFVIAISSGVLVSSVAVGVLALKVGMPKAFAGLGFMGIAGLGGLGPLIFKKDRGKVTRDERDGLINQRAALASFALSYLFVGLACMIPFSILGPTATISAIWLPMIFGGAGIVAFFVHSVAILLQYGWRNKENE